MDGAQLLKTWIDREPSTQVTFPLSCGRMRGAQSYETWENISTTIFHLWRDVTGGIINTSDDHRHCDLLAKGEMKDDGSRLMLIIFFFVAFAFVGLMERRKQMVKKFIAWLKTVKEFIASFEERINKWDHSGYSFGVITPEGMLNPTSLSSFMAPFMSLFIVHRPRPWVNSIPPHVINEATPQDVWPLPAAQPGNDFQGGSITSIAPLYSCTVLAHVLREIRNIWFLANQESSSFMTLADQEQVQRPNKNKNKNMNMKKNKKKNRNRNKNKNENKNNHVVQTHVLVNPNSKQAIPPHVINDVPPPKLKMNICDALTRLHLGWIVLMLCLFPLLSKNGVSNNEQDHYVQSTLLGPSSQVQSPVFWTSKLTDGEITRISLRGGLDWDSLAGLLDIPYNEQEEIRFNDTKYPTFSLKFEAILRYFNDSNDYDREILKKCFKILQRGDLLREMLPAENKNRTDELETTPSQIEVSIPEKSESLHLRGTPLSPREMHILSKHIVGQWQTLAGLLGVTRADINNIQLNPRYHDARSQAEKILSKFNNREDFSREKLAEALKEIGKLELIKPVITGQWRSLFKVHVVQTQVLVNPAGKQAIPPHVINEAAPQDVPPPPAALPSNELKMNIRDPLKRTHLGWTLLMFCLFPLLSKNGVSNNEQDHYVQAPVFRRSKLTNGEITMISRPGGSDWDSLAGLLDISYYEQEKIRLNHTKYPTFSSKFEAILRYFNDSKFCNRKILKKCFKILQRGDLQREMLPVENENRTDELETTPSQIEFSIPEKSESLHLRYTPLSPREMHRLSKHIVGQWRILACLLGVTRADINNIHHNPRYHDARSQAEKILSKFNNREDFSRKKLAEALEEIGQLELINPVITGQWRSL